MKSINGLIICSIIQPIVTFRNFFLKVEGSVDARSNDTGLNILSYPELRL